MIRYCLYNASKYLKISQIYAFAVFKFIKFLLIKFPELILIINLDFRLKMDKPLAVEYTGKKKWYAYEVFEQLKFDQSERMHILKSQDSQELHSGDFRFDFDEQNKQEDQKNSDEYDSASSSDNSEDEIIKNYHQADLQSLKKEINDLKNDFHTWMEKISAPLNIIANSIVQNKPPVIEMPIIE